MKILLIEDDPTQSLLLQRHLERARHEVLARDNTTAALDILQGNQIQFLITDWDVPGLSGVELVRQIREANLPYYTYIIVITGKQDHHNIVEGLNAGADDYIVKPFNLREFLARVAVGERIIRLETRLRQANEEMEKLVNLDYLTGLLNRRAIYRAAHAEIERAKRTGKPVGFLFLDLDKFKTINDSHGHLTSDEALKAVARTIQSNLRPYDLCGRWAGDEFLIILPGVNTIDCQSIAERIRACIAKICIPAQSINLKINASVGGYVLQNADHSTDINAIIAEVDRALYLAKQGGRGKVQIAMLQEMGAQT